MSVKYADFLKFRSARRGRRRPSSEYRGEEATGKVLPRLRGTRNSYKLQLQG